MKPQIVMYQEASPEYVDRKYDRMFDAILGIAKVVASAVGYGLAYAVTVRIMDDSAAIGVWDAVLFGIIAAALTCTIGKLLDMRCMRKFGERLHPVMHHFTGSFLLLMVVSVASSVASAFGGAACVEPMQAILLFCAYVMSAIGLVTFLAAVFMFVVLVYGDNIEVY